MKIKYTIIVLISFLCNSILIQAMEESSKPFSEQDLIYRLQDPEVAFLFLNNLIINQNAPALEYTLKELNVNPNITDMFHSSPLLIAIKSGNYASTKLLLEAGANPDFQNEFKNTALHYAALYNYPHLVQLLLDNNANPLIVGTLGNAFQTAINNGRGKYISLKLLLRHYLIKILNRPFALATQETFNAALQQAMLKPEFFSAIFTLSSYPPHSELYQIYKALIKDNKFDILDINLKDPQLRTYQEIFEQEIESKDFPHLQLWQREMTGKKLKPRTHEQKPSAQTQQYGYHEEADLP